MGYACPVCETPQRDAEHLADHLAFTAMLHGDAHEQWLDEHAADWAEEGAADLAPVVAAHAEETPYDEVFEESLPADTHANEGGHDHGIPSGGTAQFGTEPSDETRRVVAEAREMTQAMLDGDTAGTAATEDGNDAATEDGNDAATEDGNDAATEDGNDAARDGNADEKA